LGGVGVVVLRSCWFCRSLLAWDRLAFRQAQQVVRAVTETPNSRLTREPASPDAVKVREHLREHYGLFWRHKTRLLLIIGEPTRN